jgi:hypothetical protein
VRIWIPENQISLTRILLLESQNGNFLKGGQDDGMKRLQNSYIYKKFNIYFLDLSILKTKHFHANHEIDVKKVELAKNTTSSIFF